MTDITPVRRYTDGHPLDDIHYREYKILLAADLFYEPERFEEYWNISVDIGRELGVKTTLNPDPFKRQVRRVLFYDTPNFDLYRNAFILRKRTFYDDGWPRREHELAVKFRHPDRDTAAEVNIHPHIPGDKKVKFKEELLPLKEKLGGMRSLFSHNCILTTENYEIQEGLQDVERHLPSLRRIPMPEDTKISLVNSMAVEEIEVVPGYYDFGHGYTAKASVAIWRNRASEESLVGEFAFQAKFKREDELHSKALALSEQFFKQLQTTAPEWVQLGTTKTALVYGLHTETPVGHD